MTPSCSSIVLQKKENPGNRIKTGSSVAFLENPVFKGFQGCTCSQSVMQKCILPQDLFLPASKKGP